MTLIVGTFVNQIPALIGDILITSYQQEDESQLPVYLQGLDFKFNGIGVFPRELAQKIYIISDLLCVGLAGNLLAMKNF